MHWMAPGLDWGQISGLNNGINEKGEGTDMH